MNVIKAYRRSANEFCPGFVLNGIHYYWPNLTYQFRFEAEARTEDAIDRLIQDAIDKRQWNVFTVWETEL